jgi:hypothetical protein
LRPTAIKSLLEEYSQFAAPWVLVISQGTARVWFHLDHFPSAKFSDLD